MPEVERARLEGSCSAATRDWLRFSPDQGRIERVEAYFSGHAFDPHRHDSYGIGLTLSGVQQFDYRGAESTSLSGDLIVLHPDEEHNGRAGAEVGFTYRMAYIEPRLIRDALGHAATALPFVRRAVLDDAHLRAALVPLLTDLDRALEPLDRDHLLAALADALVRLDPSAGQGSSGATCSIAVERARSYLDANYQRVVTSEEVESITGLDRFATARQFRQRLGTSPYRYLTMRRLGRARTLIRSGLPLAEVATEVGFADQSHMTRQFRRAYGLSPGRWRAMQNDRP